MLLGAPSWWTRAAVLAALALGARLASRPARRPLAVASAAPVNPRPQGFFLNRAHHVPGSFRSVYFVTDFGGPLTLVGSDDGENFHTMVAESYDPASGRAVVDFSHIEPGAKVRAAVPPRSPQGQPPRTARARPRAAAAPGPDALGPPAQFRPKDLPATWRVGERGGALHFADGNDWLRVDAAFAPAGPDFGPRLVAEPPPWPGYLQGFFVDHAHYNASRRSLAGTRIVSDAVLSCPPHCGAAARGAALTLIGTDDGERFWALRGAYTDRAAGAVRIDFSPKGGPADLAATWDAASGRLRFADGNYWARVAQRGWRDAEGHM